ncbi:hypothetical protein KU6B_08860 [Mameliella alba]|uniref:J domain-containing protein n=1 Tax=Mameliella alba TaxID=561184 RepID=UPI0013E4FA9C|nr:J domain-containing protein [Mameliella alba]BBU54621.1 hypothetical protein KU6B_08860 [Mameliella alba]
MTRTAPMSAYRTLGVTPEDDFATIRREWIRLVKANHPDVTGGDLEEGTRILAELNNAYDALRWHNPEKLRIMKEREARERRDDKGWRARRRKAQTQGPHGDSAQAGQPSQAPREAAPQAAAQPRQEPPLYERRETLWASFVSAQAKERFRAGQRLCTAASQVDPRKMLRRA